MAGHVSRPIPVPSTLAAIIFCCLLFCQFGFSPVVSFAVLGILSSFAVSKRIFLDLNALLFLVVSIFSYMLFVINYQTSSEILREIRGVFLGIVYFYFLSGRPLYFKWTHIVSASLILILTTLCVVQYIGLKSGHVLVVPAAFFANSDDPSLAFNGLQLALEAGYEFRYRPSVFYSEPSYYGLVMISLLFLTLKADFRYKNYIIGVAILGVLLSQTLLGLMGVAIVIFLKFRGRAWHSIFSLIAAVFLIAFLLVLVGPAQGEGVWSRLYAVASLNDESALIRFVAPMRIIGDIFVSSPFGVPMSELYNFYLAKGFYGIYGSTPFHNGLLNIIMAYGVLSPLVLVLMFKVLRNSEERILLLIFLVQNGGFFSFDKIFLFTTVVLMGRAVYVMKAPSLPQSLQN